MKELLIATLDETRKGIIERLHQEKHLMSQTEIDQLLDAMLELEKMIETLKED